MIKTMSQEGIQRQEEERRLFRVRELSDRWALSKSKVYDLMDSGIVPSVRIGTSRRVSIEAVEQFEATLLNTGSV